MTDHRMATLDFGLEVKAVEDTGVFTGYASVFGNVDQGRDIVSRGAFTESLAAWRAKGRLPKMLWYHDPRQPIGVWQEMKEDDFGLLVTGRLIKGVNKADEVYKLLQNEAIDGLSIGYRTLDDEYDRDLSVRKLHKLDLMEVSLVTFQMNLAATVTSVKQLVEFNPRAAERELRDHGFTSGDAVKAIAIMKKHLQRDAGSEPSAAARDETGAMTDLLSSLRGLRAGLSS